MSNFMKKALVLMLALVMLFSVSSLTIAAIADGDDTGSSQNSGNGTNNGGTTDGSEEESVTGSLVTGWCDVVYTEDGIVVTLTPNLEAIKTIDKEMITELYNVLVEAVTKVIIEDLIDQFIGDSQPQTFATRAVDTSGINIDNVWMTALESYVTDNYTNEGETTEQAYLNFLKAVVDNDAEVDALAEHICSLVSAAVIAGAIARDDLPKADEIEPLIAEKLDAFVDDYITTYMESVINDFLDDIHEILKHVDGDSDGYCDEEGCEGKTMSELTGRGQLSETGKLVEDYIEAFIEQSIERHITQLKDGSTPSDADLYVWDAVSSFLKDKVVSIVDEYVDYLVGTSAAFGEDALHDYIKQYFDTSISGAVNAYLEGQTTGLNSLEQEIIDYIDSYVESFIKAQIDKFVEIRADEAKYEKLDTSEKAEYDREYEKLSDEEKFVYNKIYDTVRGYVDDLIEDYLAYVNGTGEDDLDDNVKAEIESFITDYFIDNYESNFNTYFNEYKAYKTGNGEKPSMYDFIENFVKSTVVDKIAEAFISAVEKIHEEIDADLETLLQDSNADIEELKAKKAELENKKAELVAKKSELEAKKSELTDAKTDIANKRAELEGKKTELEDAKADIENKRAELEDAKNQFGSGETGSQAVVNVSVRTSGEPSALNSSESDIQNAAEKLAEAKSLLADIKTLVADIKTLLLDVKPLLQDVTDLVTEVKTELQALEAEINTVKGEINDVKGEINAAKDEISSLKDEISTAKDKILEQKADFDFDNPDSEIQALESDLNTEIENLKQWYETNHPDMTPDEIDAAVNAELAEEIQDLEDLKTAVQNIADAEEQIAKAETRLSEAESELANAESELANAEIQLDDAETKLASADTQIADANAKLAEADTQLGDAETKIGTAENELTDAEDKLKDVVTAYVDVLAEFGATDVVIAGDESIDALADKFDEARTDFAAAKAAYEASKESSAIYAAALSKYPVDADDWTKIFAGKIPEGIIPDAYKDFISDLDTNFTVSDDPADYRDQFIGKNPDGSEFVKVEIPAKIYNDMLDTPEKRAPYVTKIIDYVVDDANGAGDIIDEYLEDIDISSLITGDDLEELKDYLFPSGTESESVIKEIIVYLDGMKVLVPVTPHTDANSDGLCDGCGKDVNCAHADGNADGKCDTCGVLIEEVSVLKNIIHSLDMYAVLDECLKFLHEADGVCDNCGKAMENNDCSNHVDVDEVDEFMDAVHSYFTGDMETLHTLIVEVVKTLENEKVVDPEHPEEEHNKLETLLQMVINEVLDEFEAEKTDPDPDSVISTLIKEVLGIDKTVKEIYERVDEIAAIIAKHYADTLKALENVSGPESYLELLKLIKDVQINGESVVSFTENGIAVKLEAIKNLIKDLPKPSEIAEMDAEDMFLSYDVAVFTAFGSTEFNLTLKLGGGYETVKKVAAIISENISFSIGAKGEIVLNITVPAKLAELALRACKSGRVPETLKHKVFAAFSASPDDAMALVNNVTIEELLELLDYIDKHVDFDGLLDSSYVSSFERIDDLTYDGLKEKIKAYEDYYKRAISLLNRAYAFIPEELTEKTLVDLYDGDGVFSATVENKEVDLYKLAYKAISKVTDEKTGEKYANLLASFLDDTTVSASASVSVEFLNVGKIEYCVGDDPIKVGFLPVGADIKYFANMTEYNGNYIKGWVYADGTAVDTMPNDDVKVFAVLQNIEAGITANVTITNNKITKTYDGEEIILTAAPNTAIPGATLTYQWYKGDDAIVGATDATLTLVNVADSGAYRCEIVATVGSAVYDPATTGVVTVTINKKAINLSTVLREEDDSWKEYKVEYDGEEKSVDVRAFAFPDELISFVGIKDGAVESAIKAGSYGITVEFALVDTDNYEFEGGVAEYTYTWVITPIVVEDFLTWTYDFDANGEYVGNNGIYTYGVTEGSVTTYNVSVALNEEYAELLEISVDVENSVMEASEVGEYKVTVNVQLKDANNEGDYDFDAVVEKLWYVVKRDIDLSTYEWDYDEDEDYIYNGEEGHTVSLVDLPYDIAQIVKYDHAFINEAGHLDEDAVAYLDPDNENYEAVTANYNVICDRSTELHWSVDQKVATTEDTKFDIPSSSSGRVDQQTGAIHYVYGMDIDLFVANLVEDLHDDDVIAYRYYKQKSTLVRASSVDTELWDGPYDGLPTGAGNYLVEAYISNDNYTSHAEDFSIQVPLVIEKQVIDLDVNKVVINNDTIPYDHGNEIVAELTVPQLLVDLQNAGVITVEWDEEELVGVDVEEYEVFIVVTLHDLANYELSAANLNDPEEHSYTVPWEIVKAELEYGVDFEVEVEYTGEEEYEYTGATISVEEFLSYNVIGLDIDAPADLFLVSYEGAEGLAAGEYTIYAIVSLNPDYQGSYSFTDERIEVASWTIVIPEVPTVDFGKLTWSTDYPTYNGEEQTYAGITVEKNADLLRYFTITYKVGSEFVTELKGTDAGKYTAQLWSILPNAEGEELYAYAIFAPEATVFEWEIKKAALDIGEVTFEDASVLVDGNAHKLELSGDLPEGLTVTYEATLNGITVDYESITEPGAYVISATITSGDANYETVVLTATLTILDKQVYETDDVIIISGLLLPEDYVMNADSVIDDYASLDLSLIAGENKIATLIALYDIVFRVGEEDQDVTDGEFTVKIKLPADFDITGKTIKAIYVTDDGTVEEIFAITDGEYVTFETTHFSVYGLVAVEPDVPFVCPGHEDADNDGKCDNCGEDMPEPECPGHVDEDNDGKCDNCGEDVEKDEPGTPEPPKEKPNLTWLWILLAIIGVLIIVVIILLILRKKKGDDDNTEEKAPETEPVAPEAEAVAEETSTEEAPVAEEPAVEEPKVEEPAVEEPVVEEPAVEEPAVEEPAVEEPKVEEPKAEEPKAAPVIIPSAPAEDSEGKRLVNGVIVPVRYRTSFMSRLIQSEPPIQDYYTVIKNTLLSYKGVKARTSWNFESFNKGRIQCAKLNVKGNAFQVYLALDPNEYNVNKYHFVDVSDKPKLGDVPMLMKVKSDRTLKYSIELIEEVMKKNGIEQGEVPNVDYHMPYESTDALADRDLVKVILPAGMVIDENTIIEKVNVGELLKDVKDSVSESEETAVEESVRESNVHIVDHHIAEEEIVHVDAVEADEIISDSQATEFITVIAHAPGLKPKSNKHYEINLDTICENYEDGDTVTIESLKTKRLIVNKADRIKVLARGVMTKKLTVVADKFSIQAVKMIGLAGGTAEKYKD